MPVLADWRLGRQYRCRRQGDSAVDRQGGRGEHVLQHAIGILIDSSGAYPQPIEVGSDLEGIALHRR